MGPEESNERWQSLVAAREELERDEVVVPICISRIDGKPRPLSPKAARFAEALAFSDHWSTRGDDQDKRMAA